MNQFTISFDYILIDNETPVKIICLKTGSGILVIDKDTDAEIEFFSLCEEDRDSIVDLANQWSEHYLILELGEDKNVTSIS